ncbi:DUF4304 domain-containing protein [Nocardioides caeni]|uniref:DUF4304 domain-containing protein n=1 Tax=Nocardioides caeni TaxID=574700 RepID=A0A4S8N3Y6_9ACTN|nr:DUF4304 domain-containing protein [Nocardioides caeni]THV09384.1 DUF4304 domain-containing protein [Nocardioides caeni]
MSSLSRFISDMAPALRRRGYARRGTTFRREFSAGDWVVVEFQAHRSPAAPLSFYVNLGVTLGCHTRFVLDGSPASRPPTAAMGFWSRRLAPDPTAMLQGPWLLDPDDGPAVRDFALALESHLDELDRIADPTVLLQLSREKALMTDKSRSGITLPAEAAEALLLLDAGDVDGAGRAARARLAVHPDNPVGAWVLDRV